MTGVGSLGSEAGTGQGPRTPCNRFAFAYTLRGKVRWVMRDLDKALADILAIRSQIAAGTAFRGYGPEAMAATGALALLTSIAQFLWLDDPTGRPLVFFAGWAVTAAVCCGIIWIEMQARSRRHHSGLADAM